MNPDITLPKPPKVAVYVALLTQTSSSAPTAIILLNNIGTINWTRLAPGQYQYNIPSIADDPITTTLAWIEPNNTTAIIQITSNLGNQGNIQTVVSGSDTDGILDQTQVKIEVYQPNL